MPTHSSGRDAPRLIHLPFRPARPDRRTYVVAYDIAATTRAGRQRWRLVSRRCESAGRRMQWSVFECNLTAAELESLRADLLDSIDIAEDRLAIIALGRAGSAGVERHGPLPAALAPAVIVA